MADEFGLELTGTVFGIHARRSFVAVHLTGFGYCLLQWMEGPLPEVGDILRGQLLDGGSVRNVSMGWECEIIVHATHCDRAAIDRLLGL